MVQKWILVLVVLCSRGNLLHAQKKSDTAGLRNLLDQSATLQTIDQKKANQLARQALSISRKAHYAPGIGEAYIRIGSILYANGVLDSAKWMIQDALRIFSKQKDAKWIAGSQLLLGYIYQDLGQQDSAFSSLYDALRWNAKTRDTRTQAQIHMNLGDLYLQYGKPKSAHENYVLASNISQETNDKDGVISAWDGLGRYHLKIHEPGRALVYFIRVDSASTLAGEVYYIAQNHINIAVCYESMKNYFQAKKFYTLAVSEFRTLGMQVDLARGYNNLARLFTNGKQADSAIWYSNMALKLAKENNDISCEAEACYILSEAYSQTGNFQRAFEYQKLFSVLQDSVLNAEKIKQISEMQTKYGTEKKVREIALLNSENRTKSAQRNFFIVGSALLLLMVGAIFIGLVRTRKQKKISDELLLNILPAEVANELKEKGSAEAKYVDGVTVLFTDFKDFTQISEKLSPKELVGLLHECFQTFDMIITKYKLEKVKTIGDSYMCAGGLPIPREGSAQHVVAAALEIQEYIQQLHTRQIAEGGSGIEMRLGIHTGPVVAGIVGVKKFAYDIWGDTVNTASRMESSGTPGKVNISAATYALVKDQFECTQRGLVDAKHKGKIAMYYVDGHKHHTGG
jgi:adenylate cyclase